MRILSLLIFILAVVCFSTAEAGYRRDPWGSKTWEGPGRPPHWSAPATEKSSGARDYRKRGRDRPEWRRHGDGGYHDRKKDRRIIIYRQQHDEPVVIRKQHTVIKNRYVPVYREYAPRSCGGETVYLRNSDTNELVIRYVSPAGDC